MMHSTSSTLFNLFVALVTLQQASSAVALPTRGSYGQLQRRAALAKRASPSSSQAAKARAVRQQTAASVELVKEEVIREQLAAPVNASRSTFAKAPASTIAVNPKLTLSGHNRTISYTKSNATAVEQDNTDESTSSAEEEKASSIGNGYSMFAANEGVPASASNWVAASNIVLPSAAAAPGINKREMAMKRSAFATEQQLAKRVVPHPGEPSPTIKINVIGGDVMQNFTIISSVPTKSGTATSTTTKVAQTSRAVNVVHNGTDILGNSTAGGSDHATTITFTFTVPASAIATSDETVTLVPAGDDSYVPYINGKRVETDSTTAKATCTIPVDDDILTAVAHGKDFSASCVTSSGNARKITVNVDVKLAGDHTDVARLKRDIVAFFQSPSKESTISSKTHYTRDEMLSDLWEDCIVGQDPECLELPEQ